MPDRDRPRFLPPEEPPDSSDAGVEPVRPPDRRTLAVASAVGALLLGVGGLVVVRAGDRPSAAPADVRPEYAVVPDPCAAAPPLDVRAVPPRRLVNSCAWDLLAPDRSRVFEVAFRLFRTSAGMSGSVRAARSFAGDLAYSSDPGRNGGFERNPEHLTGTGDEAYAAQASNLLVSGNTEQTATTYDMGGAEVEVRSRNVLVTVTWRGADYPASVRGRRRLVGTRLPYAEAERAALSAASAMVRRLR